MRPSLGLDLGASGVRAYLTGRSDPVADITGAATEASREQAAILLIKRAHQELGSPTVSSACLGMSGFANLDVEPSNIAHSIHELFGAEQVSITSDMVTSHFAHFGQATGTVVVVGTGTLCFSIGQESHTRIDGLGAGLGDFGSGYWIGHQAMREAVRQQELTGTSALLSALEDELGKHNQWPMKFASHEFSTFQIAQLSKVCADVAASGNSLATKLVTDAGKLAAESAIAASESTGVTQVAFGGSVLGPANPLARASFEATIRGAGLTPTPMLQSPGQGALAIAESVGSPRHAFLRESSLVFESAI